MPLLVRRIHRPKWEQINFEDTDDVTADAITNCLRTYNNDLSVWDIECENDLNDAILALITGSNQSKLSTLHYVIIDEELIINKEISIVETDGDTVVEDLVKSHKDISNLTYAKLGIIKNLIIDCIQEGRCSFFSRAQLKKIINTAIESGRLKKEDLNEELVKKEKL